MSKTPLTDAAPGNWTALTEHAKQMEQDRADLLEALKYWIPDEAIEMEYRHTGVWMKHLALIAKVERK